MCLTGVLRNTVLEEFRFSLNPENLVIDSKTWGFVDTLYAVSLAGWKRGRVTYVAVTALVILPFEPKACSNYRQEASSCTYLVERRPQSWQCIPLANTRGMVSLGSCSAARSMADEGKKEATLTGT